MIKPIVSMQLIVLSRNMTSCLYMYSCVVLLKFNYIPGPPKEDFALELNSFNNVLYSKSCFVVKSLRLFLMVFRFMLEKTYSIRMPKAEQPRIATINVFVEL